VLTRRLPRPAIGSGGPYALAAARALIDIPGMDAMTIGACRLMCSLLLPYRVLTQRACSQARHDDCC
jgi:hypothetical protein